MLMRMLRQVLGTCGEHFALSAPGVGRIPIPGDREGLTSDQDKRRCMASDPDKSGSLSAIIERAQRREEG